MAQRPSTPAALLTALACLTLLTACGNRGSLYLPEEAPGAAAPAATAPEERPEDREAKDDDERP